MVERLRNQKLPSPIKIYPGNISRFEQGLREPSPLILLAYARAAGISVEVLIDADFELPEQPAIKTTRESKFSGKKRGDTKTKSQRR
jgi:transcriptional regulator with XRE-family HTH domain